MVALDLGEHLGVEIVMVEGETAFAGDELAALLPSGQALGKKSAGDANSTLTLRDSLKLWYRAKQRALLGNDALFANRPCSGTNRRAPLSHPR